MKTAYEMRISDCSSDVCSAELAVQSGCQRTHGTRRRPAARRSRALHPAAGTRLPDGYLRDGAGRRPPARRLFRLSRPAEPADPARTSVGWGKSVSLRVDIGGRRKIQKTTNTKERDVNNY